MRALMVVNGREWRKNNPAQEASRGRAWRKKNPTQVTTLRRAWRKKNPARMAEHQAAYKKKYSAKVNASTAMRRAQQLQATPAWANQGYIEDVYRKAAIFTKRDGTPWHVDHIVPLKSPRVCGLHCEDNLQVLPGVENLTKGNRHWPYELFSLGGI
jgi:hypothetical protein